MLYFVTSGELGHYASFYSRSFHFLWKLNKLEQAIEDCTKAIKLDETYIKAYLRRAQWYVQDFKLVAMYLNDRETEDLIVSCPSDW